MPSRAAADVGIDRSNFHALLRKYGLTAEGASPRAGGEEAGHLRAHAQAEDRRGSEKAGEEGKEALRETGEAPPPG
jgi:hypothetical protein